MGWTPGWSLILDYKTALLPDGTGEKGETQWESVIAANSVGDGEAEDVNGGGVRRRVTIRFGDQGLLTFEDIWTTVLYDRWNERMPLCKIGRIRLGKIII
jgi:hypothetical protein